MTQSQFLKFVSYLTKYYQVYASQKVEEKILIKKVNDPKKVILDERLPFFSWKKFFIPKHEKLFDYQKTNLLIPKTKSIKKQALLGINFLDLKAVLLYNHIFEKDPYYQKSRQNTLIIGHSFVPKIEDNIFEEKYEEHILEHLQFDIFLAKSKEIDFQVFTGSREGQRVLEKFNYKNYRHIQFSGPIKEEGPGKEMLELRNKLKNLYNSKTWKELGKTCLECGKCSIICPTCFCFRIDDQSLEKNKGFRQRAWDSCYFPEFSEISGGLKFLENANQRIYFWYYHKFVRIPEEYGFVGCIGCRRCNKVCPVEIDIEKTLKQITKEECK